MLEAVRTALTQQSMIVHELTPTEHDLLMAKTLFMTQLVGRSLVSMELPNTIYSTQHYKRVARNRSGCRERLRRIVHRHVPLQPLRKKVYQKYMADSRKIGMQLEPMGA